MNAFKEMPLSLYVHLPWCERKCPYCDFNAHATASLSTLTEKNYLNALTADLTQETRHIHNRVVQTIFIGGGTPSLFSADGMGRLMEIIRHHLTLGSDVEVTLEANPGSAEYAKFAQFSQLGINRLSLGAQSFDDYSLQQLGRIHTAKEAQLAFAAAREAGFDNINIDLMFGLPQQTSEAAGADIQTVLRLEPEHISYYQLTIEPNTVFYRHRLTLPDEQTIEQIENKAQSMFAKRAYQHYEVSAYAKTGRQSRHNLNYWYYGDYLGIGAGAHSKLSYADGTVQRFAKSRQPESYMQQLNAGHHRVAERIVNQQELIFEFMLNALRLTKGFSKRLFTQRTGLDFKVLDPRIDQLKQKELIEESSHAINLTQRGLRFLNEVQMTFLS